MTSNRTSARMLENAGTVNHKSYEFGSTEPKIADQWSNYPERINIT